MKSWISLEDLQEELDQLKETLAALRRRVSYENEYCVKWFDEVVRSGKDGIEE